MLLFVAQKQQALKPEYVAPLVAYLCHESSTANGQLFELGAGWVSRIRWERSKGAFFPANESFTPELLKDGWSAPATCLHSLPSVAQST